jgi:hypothetical protein
VSSGRKRGCGISACHVFHAHSSHLSGSMHLTPSPNASALPVCQATLCGARALCACRDGQAGW